MAGKIKLNEPITEEEHEIADKNHRALIELQKQHLLELAEKINRGAPLNELDTARVVSALHYTANQLNPVRKRKAGKPSKIKDEAYLEYAAMRAEGASKNHAIETIAESYQVSTTAVKKKLGAIGKGPEREINKQNLDLAFSLIGEEPET